MRTAITFTALGIHAHLFPTAADWVTVPIFGFSMLVSIVCDIRDLLTTLTDTPVKDV